MNNKKSTRSRNWTFVLYPESMPSNWQAIIDELHIEYVVSPLHDKDLNADGELKKAHYHVLLLFGGVKSYEQVLNITDELNCPIPQQCHNSKALVRYMAHLDNPDKMQYDISDIKGYGGVDVAELLKPTSSERYSLIKEMITFVKEENITEYKDLVDYAMFNRFDDWLPLLADNCTYMLGQYIKSNRHSQNRSANYEEKN